MRKVLVLLVVLGIGLANGLGGKPAMARFTPQPCKNAFSPQQEITEGQKAKAEVYKTMPVLPNSSPVTEYVQQLGAKLVAHAPGYRWPFEFHVVNESDINAFALPGGPIFVNLATIQAATTEAQLAGVMAHEISHVVQRHATCNATKQQQQGMWYGLGQVAAGIFLPGSAGSLAQTGIGAVAGLGYLRMSREAEKQADLMGTDILYDTDYDPRAMPQFFEVIEAKYGAGGAQMLSDHPNPGNRVGYVQDEIDTLPAKANYVKTSPEFKRIHDQVSAMHAYTPEEIKSGAWKTKTPNQAPSQVSGGSAAAGGNGSSASTNQSTNQSVKFTPSGRWKPLDTRDYTLDYPDNWQAATGTGTNATIAPAGGATDQSVVYGVVVESYAIQQGTSFASAFTQLVQQMIQQNSGLTQSGNVEDVLVNKRPAKSVELTGQSALVRNGQALPEHDWLVAIQHSSGVLTALVFIAPGEDAQVLRPTYEHILRSFKAK
ncbi:MAG TPA: M48 family metallopeptidase [Acidisarcina sp.]|nr:M48 family metallopeptidase [Acidisarcina sp.]